MLIARLKAAEFLPNFYRIPTEFLAFRGRC